MVYVAGGPLFAQATGSLAGQAFSLRAEGPDLEDLKRAGGSPTFINIGFGANWLTYRGRLVKAPDLVAAGALEAMPVDPVYSGKGLAGLIALAREGRWQADTDVIFIHTGGAPALFAYQGVLRI